MKKTHYLLFFLLIISQLSLAQSHPYEVRFSYEIECEVVEEKISASRAGLLHSLIGDYGSAIQYSDIAVSWGVDTIAVDQYATEPALPLIIEAARNHQIVIISESHLKPQHWIFADKLITALAQIGCSHLGLETFTSINNSDALLHCILYVLEATFVE